MADFPGSTTPSEDDLGVRLAKAQLDLVLGLRKIRVDKGLSVQAVATAMGVDPAQVSRIESAGTNPTMASVRRYATAIGALFQVQVMDFAVVREAEKSSREVLERLRNAVESPIVADFEWTGQVALPMLLSGTPALRIPISSADDWTSTVLGQLKPLGGDILGARAPSTSGLTRKHFMAGTQYRGKGTVEPHHRPKIGKKAVSH